jgi:hypothetical protein
MRALKSMMALRTVQSRPMPIGIWSLPSGRVSQVLAPITIERSTTEPECTTERTPMIESAMWLPERMLPSLRIE